MRCRPGDGRWPGTADSAELRVVIAIPPSDLGWALLANCSPHGRPAPGLTGALGSGLLEEAERAGLFLIPLDEVRGWWRYHHLFASLLRARLQEEQPGWVPKLHHNAAAWYAGCGLADDAIGHSVAAGETAWAARIIEQHFDMVYNIRGEAATIHRWLSVLPDEVVRSRPRLLLAQAIMTATSGHLHVVEPLLDAVECAPADWLMNHSSRRLASRPAS